MKQNLRVVMITPEASPFAGAGKPAGLCAALSSYLSSSGMRVSLILPKYRTPEIESLEITPVLPEVLVPFGGDKVKAAVHKAERDDYDLYFIDHPKYFLRENIYGTPAGDYLDNDERFIFFCRAALEFLLQARLAVDIIHCHDWQTALVPVFIKTHYAGESSFQSLATVFTLHRPESQGEFPAESLVWTGLGWDVFAPRRLSRNGKINLLKAGLIFADLINTVEAASPEESRPGRFEPGLREILKSRRGSYSRLREGDGWGNYVELYKRALKSRRGG